MVEMWRWKTVLKKIPKTPSPFLSYPMKTTFLLHVPKRIKRNPRKNPWSSTHHLMIKIKEKGSAKKRAASLTSDGNEENKNTKESPEEELGEWL
jgi:hypothetical protein